MTHKEFKRQRKWDQKVEPAYNAGLMDGMDMAFCGEPRPHEILSDIDTTFYFRRYLRRAQEVSNAAIARNRGKVDGYDMAMEQIQKADDEDYIEREFLRGMDELCGWLEARERAA